MIVLDASAAIEWLLDSRSGQKIDGLMISHGDELHVPHLLDIEVAQVLRRLVLQGKVAARDAVEALHVLAGMSCVRYPHYFYISRIWDLRNNLSAYDAMYVALAESLDALLVTCDPRLAASPGHRARIQLIT